MDNSFSFFVSERTYCERVQSDLVDIVMEVDGVSEKDFKVVHEIIQSVKLLTDIKYIKNIILEFEIGEKRSTFCAEYIYDKIKEK